MRPLATLPRAWPAPELPGYRQHPDEYATYSTFAYDELPPVGRRLDDDLHWLLREPLVTPSLAETEEAATTPATEEALERLLAGQQVTLPRAFAAFIRSGGLRARVRSCTDCYLDLADFAVPVASGGWLIHFLSDSQWVLHWLLYCGTDGGEAVVATPRPLGFELEADGDEATVRVFDPAAGAAVCAESFSEFLYRFWIENEIWFRRSGVDGPVRRLTAEQRRYVEHYARRTPAQRAAPERERYDADA
jgi:hypothetical protein